jgi:hypothetical protein
MNDWCVSDRSREGWLAMRRWAVAIYRHLRKAHARLFAGTTGSTSLTIPSALDLTKPTAVLVVGDRPGAGIEVLSWVQHAYPGRFGNIVFLGLATMAAHGDEDRKGAYASRDTLELSLCRYVDHCRRRGLVAEYRLVCAADPIPEFRTLMRQIMRDYPQVMCFAGDLVVAGACAGGGLMLG